MKLINHITMISLSIISHQIIDSILGTSLITSFALFLITITIFTFKHL
jgi:hypothetical protein